MKKIILLAALLSLAQISNAELKLKQPCGDHMVLQQNTESSVWGFADAGSVITVKTSWDGKSYKVTASSEGEWTAKVKTPAAGYTPYSIDVKGNGGHIIINDVLIGEVWLASGQSNMDIPLRGYTNCPIENYNEVITRPAARNRIRMNFSHADMSAEKLKEVRKSEGWECADANSIPEMSAVAYFFAKKLNDVLDVPVGIVAFTFGGTKVESWIPKEVLEKNEPDVFKGEVSGNNRRGMMPSMCYNALVYPLKGYTAKGFIWYQGCSNVGSHDSYARRMKYLIDSWRADWDDKNCAMPFYLVEIAPYLYDPANGLNGVLLRQAQHEAAKTAVNSGIVCTNDLVAEYEADNIHPCRKEPVGNRLAYLALNRNYGFKRVACNSPEAISAKLVKNPDGKVQISVELLNCPNGIDRTSMIKGLEIAGKDGIRHSVEKVRMRGQNMFIDADGIDNPAAVLYGWADFRPGNIHSCEGLPLVPFYLEIVETE